MTSIHRYAQITGAVYLFIAAAGAFGIGFVPGLLVTGDINATLSNILANETMMRWAIVSALFTQLGHLLLVLMLHKILAPVNLMVANLMVILVLVGVPIAMLNEASYGVILGLLDSDQPPLGLIASLLDFHDYGIAIVQIFWGLWLFPFGYLVYKSGFLPKFIGVTLMIGCFGYLADSLIVFLALDTPITFAIYMFWGEVFILLWLMIRGVNTQKWQLSLAGEPALG